MSDVESTNEHGGTSRRTVVRTAAHAAWAVPAIQIVAAAPAFANHSPGHLGLTATTNWNGGGASTKLNLSATVTNSGAATTTGQITVTFTIPTEYGAITGVKNPSGWTASLVGRVLTYTRNAAGVPAGNTSFSTDIDVATRRAGTIAVTANAPGFTPGSASPTTTA